VGRLGGDSSRQGVVAGVATSELIELPDLGDPAPPDEPARRRRSLPAALVAAIRPRQCITKNLLVFTALIFARRPQAGHAPISLFDLIPILEACAAYLLFCLTSGAVYLLNDIKDVAQDRLHPKKRFRPIAAGELPVPLAWFSCAALIIVALVGAALVDPLMVLVVGVYFAVQVGYSFGLKHQVILDVFIISSGFVLRAIAGAVAIGVPISPWFYTLLGLGALFLGFGKRRAEIMLLNEGAGQHRRVLEEYSATLLEELIAIVTASIVMAYALYTFSAENLPKNHAMMLTIPFVLYGLFRYLYLVYRKNEGGSPEQVLLADRPLLTCILLWLIACVVILYV
jgi:4-hydroxybenzoate polyprenyltransferase